MLVVFSSPSSLLRYWDILLRCIRNQVNEINYNRMIRRISFLLLVCVVFLQAAPYNEAIRRWYHDDDVSGEEPRFVLKEIRSRLAANSMSGQIEAEVEVSSHADFNIRWYLTQRDDTGFFYVPAATTMGMDVYNIRYFSGSSGKAFYSSQLIFHPVPPVPEVNVVLEISSTNYGPSLLQPVTASVYTGYYPTVESIHPNTITPVSGPGSVVHYTPGSGQSMNLQFLAQASGSLDVSVYKLLPSAQLTQLTTDVLLDIIRDNPAETIEVSSAVSGDVMQTTLDLHVDDMDTDGKRQYLVRFRNGENLLYYKTPVLPSNTNSLWNAEEIHLELESCNRMSARPGSHATFDFHRGVPNCVRCRAASPALISMEITREDMSPIGSSTTHAVYWYEEKPDVLVSEFVIFGYQYQSVSYQGIYICTARARNGIFQQAGFEIRVV